MSLPSILFVFVAWIWRFCFTSSVEWCCRLFKWWIMTGIVVSRSVQLWWLLYESPAAKTGLHLVFSSLAICCVYLRLLDLDCFPNWGIYGTTTCAFLRMNYMAPLRLFYGLCYPLVLLSRLGKLLVVLVHLFVTIASCILCSVW